MAMQFQTLKGFGWNSNSEELIATHLKAAERAARFWQRRFPGEDMEARAMSALYAAAATYSHGCGHFYSWFRWKLRGQISIAIRSRLRKPKFKNLDMSTIDSRLSYRDERLQ